MSNISTALIDKLVGTVPGSHLDEVQDHRRIARENIENAYQALFVSPSQTHVSLTERHVIALFVSGLHQEPLLTTHYLERLEQIADNPGLLHQAVKAEYERGQTEGPYGQYPAGSLSAEDKEGPVHRVTPENQTILGKRLVSALEHAHLLTFHPRDASSNDLALLIDAGWTVNGIVTISQLVSYLAFQVRVVTGLTQLATRLSNSPQKQATSQSN